MKTSALPSHRFRQFAVDYGMIFVLLLLCVVFSVLTYREQHPTGRDAARSVFKQLSAADLKLSCAVVAGEGSDDLAFANELEALITAKKVVHVASALRPEQVRELLEGESTKPDVLLCSESTASWSVVQRAGTVRIVRPLPYKWPNFLKRENLLNVANQIAVIAIVAIGLTLVIVTGGIDLSVGSLIALSAVVCTVVIREMFGGDRATPIGMMIGALLGILVCGGAGLLSGSAVVLFGVPPFIATLAMMLVASGAAFLISEGQSIYQVPDTFVWLGRGTAYGLPIAVLLMLGLYIIAHVFMRQHAVGRYIYAIGGNAVAARLSGVPVKRVLLFAYAVSGGLAGVGGVVMASQLKSGSPTYGQMYELYVIAAVVVGGASLSGGEGKILATLIGAFIIAVIQNGMNLTGVESYTQKVVLGLVILAAVLLDAVKKRGMAKLALRSAG